MSRTNYYYDKNGQLVWKPGELCDLCSELGRIVEAGTLLPIPVLGACCGGSEEGNAHAHRACAEEELTLLKAKVAAFEAALK